MSELGEITKAVWERREFLIERLLYDSGYAASDDGGYINDLPLAELEHLYIKELSKFGKQISIQQGGTKH